jgi:hypothetical protein
VSTCVICRTADAVDEDYCAKCSKIAAELDADDTVSCADFLHECQERARIPLITERPVDFNAALLGSGFASIFERVR